MTTAEGPATRVLGSLLLALAATSAGGALPSDAVARLERWLAQTHDLEARFTQTLVSGALGAAPPESGRLYLSRPGRMRWDYEQPERKVALVIGDRTRFYLAEDRQLFEGTLERSEAVLVDLLSTSQPLREQFELRATGDAAGHEIALQLIPRVPSATSLGEITVFARPSDGAIRSVEVKDAAGNTIRTTLEVIRRNGGLDPAIFEFEPPPGTEIVARP